MQDQLYRTIFDILTIVGPLVLLNWRLENRFERRMSAQEERISAQEERMSAQEERMRTLDERWLKCEEQILKIMNRLEMNK